MSEMEQTPRPEEASLLFTEKRDYINFYNYCNAYLHLLAHNGPIYEAVVRDDPSIADKLSTANVRAGRLTRKDVDDIIYKYNDVCGVKFTRRNARASRAEMDRYSQTAASMSGEGNVPSLQEIDRQKARYDKFLVDRNASAKKQKKDTQKQFTKARREKNKKGWKVFGTLIAGLLGVAATALGVGTVGAGIYYAMSAAVASAAGLASGAFLLTIVGVWAAVRIGSRIIPKMFGAIRERFKEARNERKSSKQAYKEARQARDKARAREQASLQDYKKQQAYEKATGYRGNAVTVALDNEQNLVPVSENTRISEADLTAALHELRLTNPEYTAENVPNRPVTPEVAAQRVNPEDVNQLRPQTANEGAGIINPTNSATNPSAVNTVPQQPITPTNERDSAYAAELEEINKARESGVSGRRKDAIEKFTDKVVENNHGDAVNSIADIRQDLDQTEELNISIEHLQTLAKENRITVPERSVLASTNQESSMDRLESEIGYRSADYKKAAAQNMRVNGKIMYEDGKEAPTRSLETITRAEGAIFDEKENILRSVAAYEEDNARDDLIFAVNDYVDELFRYRDKRDEDNPLTADVVVGQLSDVEPLKDYIKGLDIKGAVNERLETLEKRAKLSDEERANAEKEELKQRLLLGDQRKLKISELELLAACFKDGLASYPELSDKEFIQKQLEGLYDYDEETKTYKQKEGAKVNIRLKNAVTRYNNQEKYLNNYEKRVDGSVDEKYTESVEKRQKQKELDDQRAQAQANNEQPEDTLYIIANEKDFKQIQILSQNLGYNITKSIKSENFVSKLGLEEIIRDSETIAQALLNGNVPKDEQEVAVTRIAQRRNLIRAIINKITFNQYRGTEDLLTQTTEENTNTSTETVVENGADDADNSEENISPEGMHAVTRHLLDIPQEEWTTGMWENFRAGRNPSYTYYVKDEEQPDESVDKNKDAEATADKPIEPVVEKNEAAANLTGEPVTPNSEDEKTRTGKPENTPAPKPKNKPKQPGFAFEEVRLVANKAPTLYAGVEALKRYNDDEEYPSEVDAQVEKKNKAMRKEAGEYFKNLEEGNNKVSEYAKVLDKRLNDAENKETFDNVHNILSNKVNMYARIDDSQEYEDPTILPEDLYKNLVAQALTAPQENKDLTPEQNQELAERAVNEYLVNGMAIRDQGYYPSQKEIDEEIQKKIEEKKNDEKNKGKGSPDSGKEM